MEDAPTPASKLPTELVTWTTLLGHWTDLVKAGEGLRRSTDEDDRAWRASIPEVIRLQAITFALAELDRIEGPDRGLARDRAAIGVEEASARLDVLWSGVSMPETLLEIAADASLALETAVYAGLRWIRWRGVGRLEMPEIDLEVAGTAGTLACAQPGTILLSGEPVAWWTEREPPRELLGEGFEFESGPAVQIYRRLDDAGRAIGDLVAPLADLPVGLPILVPISLDGVPIGRFTVARDRWLTSNRRAFEAVEGDYPVGYEPGASPTPED
ncbi:MAG: hypothetical protein CMJ27_01785 [Phycisphaerae bacterium]|nr:hypothetical protein [Phycisphaerae bacterium]OUX02998.1 MAG: hypothetical protein CBD91_01220 [Phycisphaeraceae bacterium TMED231]